jgi:prepilin-type N-terminal cleavage/methylation domain-containing protein
MSAMQRRRRRTVTTHNARQGMTLAEVVVVLGVIGLLVSMIVPSLLEYVRTAALQAGTRELATAMNLARQIAVARKTSVCIDAGSVDLRLRLGGCQGPLWTGPMTDSAGVIRLSNSATLRVASNARIVFTALGAATPSGTYTVTDSRTNASRAIVVAASGRVSVE